MKEKMKKFWVIIGIINLLYIIAVLVEDKIKTQKSIDYLKQNLAEQTLATDVCDARLERVTK
jgi:hypothetical protein